LRNFKTWAASQHSTPLIAINMHEKGQPSRILNAFMTPVSHPALPFKAAPGQMSAAEIRRGLSLLGEIQSKKFYIFGEPIKASPSPRLHNTLFTQTGLPHTYGRFETHDAATVKDLIRAPDFGGASVTIPLKLDIMPLLDSIADEAQIIGAVNTIIPVPSANPKEPPHLIGRNTDWLGMVHCLRQSGAFGSSGTESSLVVGGGGTARAAIHALHSMGYAPIYLLGRQPAKVAKMVQSFPTAYDLRVLESVDEVGALESVPSVAIGTIPAQEPIDAKMGEILQEVFKNPGSEEKGKKVLLEMAYKPSVTALMEMAERAGWTTIPGLEALVGQGMYQFKYWTGIMPLLKDCRVSFACLEIGLRRALLTRMYKQDAVLGQSTTQVNGHV
jgi:pentafunctional AROM polypeptide